MNFALVVRGDSLEPRYAAHDKIYSIMSQGTSRIVEDASAIGGYSQSHLALDNVNATGGGVSYSGRQNAGTQKDRTVWARFKLTTEGQYFVVYSSRTSGSNPSMLFELLIGQNSGQGTVRVNIKTMIGWNAHDANYNIPTQIGVWHDLVVSYTGDTAANGIKIYFDGTLAAQATASYPQEEPYDYMARTTVSVAYGYMWSQSQHYIGEVGSVDGVYTPADFLLTDGTYGLNGASRTAYVECEDFNGTTWPLARHVVNTAPPFYKYSEEVIGTLEPTKLSTFVPEESVDYGFAYTFEDVEYIGKLRSFGGFGNLRQFLNYILGEIGSASLTDEEWTVIEEGGLVNDEFVYDQATYEALAGVLETRGSGPDNEKLEHYFLAKGAQITPFKEAVSGILLGDSLELSTDDPEAQTNILIGGPIE